MQSLTIPSKALVYLFFFYPSYQNDLTSPFALSFSRTAIFASRFNSSSSIELDTYPLPSKYNTLYTNVLRTYDLPMDTARNIDSAQSVFHDSVVPVNKSLSKRLGHEVDYAVVYVPSIFDYRLKNAAFDSVYPDGHPEHKTGSGYSKDAACHAYGFLDHKNLGLEPKECSYDGPISLVMVLEYERDYLYAWIMEVKWELLNFPTIHGRMCRECGEEKRMENGQELYNDRVTGFMKGFLDERFRERIPAYGFPDAKIDDIRAVVIAGEASQLPISDLKINVRQSLGQSKSVRFMTDIDPSEVVAYGAAVLARRTQNSPYETFINKTPDMTSCEAMFH